MSNKNFIAVDIGGTKISIVLFCDDEIIRQIKLETNPIEKPTINGKLPKWDSGSDGTSTNLIFLSTLILLK